MSESLAPQSGAPFPWLLADIGGSNARFACVPAPGELPQQVRTLAVAEHPSLAGAARAYLDQLDGALQGLRPASAALAVATVANVDPVRFTNSPWRFARAELAQALNLRRLLVLNDFEALALSLPRLRASQWQGLDGRSPRFDAPLAVVGPGTGLGVAGLLPLPGGQAWLPVPGEGGHATLAAVDAVEAELLALARREHAHVSAERLLSGIGLPLLYRCCAALRGEAAHAEVDARWIVEQGLNGADAAASASLDHFCALLGSFCGSVALTFGAQGGVFVGGGIVPRLGARFEASAFRQRFEAKGRFAAYLAAIPTLLITDTLAALDGSAQALAQLGALR